MSAEPLDGSRCDEVLRRMLATPKRTKTAQPAHWSDCALYNEPALSAGPCDCGGFTPEKAPASSRYRLAGNRGAD